MLDMGTIQAIILQIAMTAATTPDSSVPVQSHHVHSPTPRKIIPKHQKRPSKTRNVKKHRGVYENKDTHI